MLYAILGRNGIKHGEVTATDVDSLYSYGISKTGVLNKPFTREIAAPMPSFITTTMKEHGNTRKSSLMVVPNAPRTLPLDYVGIQHRVLEIVCRKKDKHGVKYLSLFDAENPAYPIRLYYDKKNEILGDFKGCEVVTNIINLFHEGNFPHYRANPANARLVYDDPEYIESFADSDGVLLVKEAWEKKYEQCDYCSSSLIAGSGVTFTKQGVCLCKACSADKEALFYYESI